MNASELLTELRNLGARVWVEGTELKLKAPKGALTEELRGELTRNKASLLAMLAPAADATEIPRVSRDGPIPLSSAQERLWFLDQLEPDLTAYNMWLGARLSGPLDRRALERTVEEIIRRHEILRACYRQGDRGPEQTFVSPRKVELEPLRNDAGLETVAWREEATKRLADLCREPYDLAEGPLFRYALAKITDEEHVVVLGMHHSVADGWSMGSLIDELSALYPAYLAGRESPLDELPIQYADFAVWQRAFRESAVYREEKAYWKAKLAGELPVLEFPTDRPRPPIQSYDGQNARRPIELGRLVELTKLANEERTTLFVALLALYLVLVRRTTGLEDILIGTPVANRERPELTDLLGFFSNTIVVRADLSGDPTFRELLRHTREECFDAFEHKQLPFEDLVDDLRPERSLSYTPIFQTIFLLEESPSDRMKFGDLEVEFLDLKASVSRNDVIFGLFRNPEKATLWAEYRTDLYDAVTIERLLAAYDALFASALAAPDTPISRLSVLDRTDRRKVVEQWNATDSAYPRDSTIVREFEARVAEHPKRVAAIFAKEEGGGADTLTYGELNRRANQVAHELIERGVGPDVLVGLSTERTLPMLVGLLGILKAGGAYVPLDAGYPQERLRFMIEDAELSIVLVQASLRDRLPEDSGTVMVLEGDAFDERSTENPEPRAGIRNLAYVMFTSGSTGRPKGVCVEHRSVLRLVSDPNFCTLGPDEVLLHFAPIAFDASTLEVWGALLRGGRMVVYPPTEPSLEDLGRVIREHGVTTAWLTAGLFSLMVEHRLEDLRGLRQLLAGGDVLPVPQVNRVLRELPHVRLVNGYGPTENTTFTCCHQISVGGEIQGSVPIGKPVSDTRVYILDANLEPVPVGVPGDLYAGGHGVARGYLRRPELTQERFVPDPFHPDPDARMYATGDGARWLPDGTIEFLGRRDAQVKVRGFRIELGEIESVLGEHAGVSECVVIVREDQPGDKRIVAYVVPDAEELDSATLRTALKLRLPEYMVPAHFVPLEELPLSPNGKVDKNALPSPDPSRDVEADYEVPSNETERKLAMIWQDVLGVERVGIHDNFFELGGNSLLSTQAMTKIRSAFEIELPLRRLFEDPTVADLARRIGGDAGEIAQRSYGETFDRCLIPLQPRGWKPPLFIIAGAHAHEDDFLRFVGSLLPHMPKDQPIYGFKARGLDGESAPHESAEAMAADYVREMRELQPEGPYLLAGNCVGGIVAFEMALQLRDAGQEVALLALLDTTAPVQEYRNYVSNHYRFWKLERFVDHWRKLGELSIGEKLSYLFERVRRKASRIVPLSEENKRRLRIEDVERKYSQVLADYKPRNFDGKVSLIINEEFQRHMPDAGWTPFVSGELEIRVAPGDHVTRLTANAAPSAQLLEACIADAMRESSVRSAVG